MIKLLRVDDRLIHGQVAVSWTSYLGADTIVVANDKAITDKLMQMAFNMAKPPQAVLSIKSLDGAVAVINNPKHAARTIFVVTASVEDARYLMGKCPSITTVCGRRPSGAGKEDGGTPGVPGWQGYEGTGRNPCHGKGCVSPGSAH